MTRRAAAGPTSGSDRGEASDCLDDEVRHLRLALCSRDVIGQAKGVLMVLHGCTADEAFTILRDRSQRTNVKLRLVAEAVVAERMGRRSSGRRGRVDTPPTRKAAMTRESRKHVTVQHGERCVAAAEVEALPDQPAVHASLSVDAGQLPPGTRTKLVNAVLDLPEMAPGAQFTATVPAGDGEMLDQVRERCREVQTHQAGASVIVAATVDDPSEAPN